MKHYINTPHLELYV